MQLFQGKVQKLKDRQFGRVQLFVPHKNPSATIGENLNLHLHDIFKNMIISESPIKHYKHHSLVRAYQGDTFFWGLVPQPGDHVVFTFEVGDDDNSAKICCSSTAVEIKTVYCGIHICTQML